jgi:hypothetical protein
MGYLLALISLLDPSRSPSHRQLHTSRGHGATRHPSYLHGHSALSCASSRHSGQGLLTGSDLIPDTVLPIYSCEVRSSVLPASRYRRIGPWGPWSERRSALHGHAAASTDEHVWHDAARLVSTRVRRAAAARDVRSAGTASPVPKYISSGVCPRNAECGSTRLCPST